MACTYASMNEPLSMSEERPAPQDRLGHLVVRFPELLPVLHRHQLDYCCGGNVPVAQACATAGLDLDALMAEMNAAIELGGEPLHWDDRPLAELTEFIRERYHVTHRVQLPILLEMARKVESVHAEKPSAPHGLADALESWIPEMVQHMEKEEQVLFPMIEAGRGELAGAPVQVLEHEHQDHGQNLAKVRELAHDFEPPAEACTTWLALYSGLASFERDLMAHVHLENHVLFPRALAGAPAQPKESV
jgi:regulator of cell morphogenesis and NO signaling